MNEWLQDAVRAIAVAWNNVWHALETNLAFQIIVLLVLAVVIIRLVRWAFEPMPDQARQGGSGRPSFQPNPTNGMVTPGVVYPVVVRLFELDAEQKPTAKVRGFSIRPAPGPKEPVYLLLDGEWVRLDPIQSLHHLQIEKIQEQLRDGIREELPAVEGEAKGKKQFKQITPPGHFFLNGETWKLEETISLAGEIVKGQLFSFKGGKGVFELISASIAGKPEEGSVLVLERTVDEFRRSINETWASFNIFPSSVDEVAGRVEGDILLTIGLTAQPA